MRTLYILFTHYYRCFDERARGYARSEGVSFILLQQAKDARRIYAQLVHAKSNCDGYKEQGITFPSGFMQARLLREAYQECGVNPLDVTFMEAHGTGTRVGDPEEIMALDEVSSLILLIFFTNITFVRNAHKYFIRYSVLAVISPFQLDQLNLTSVMVNLLQAILQLLKFVLLLKQAKFHLTFILRHLKKN